jgi:hypothetical protein
MVYEVWNRVRKGFLPWFYQDTNYFQEKVYLHGYKIIHLSLAGFDAFITFLTPFPVTVKPRYITKMPPKRHMI